MSHENVIRNLDLTVPVPPPFYIEPALRFHIWPPLDDTLRHSFPPFRTPYPGDRPV